MKSEKQIDILNKLIETNNDRIESYITALQAVKDPDLEELFFRLSDTSVKCKEELILVVIRLGGQPIEGSSTSVKFYRAWMDIKTTLGNNRKAVISACEFGEDITIATYANLLRFNAEELGADLMSLLILQHYQIKADRNELKLLSEAQIDVKNTNSAYVGVR